MELRDRMVRDVSRTFALSIEVLPAELRRAVGIGYLMFRISDGIEDHDALRVEDKVALLDAWANVLDGTGDVMAFVGSVAGLDGSDPEVSVIQHADLVLQWLNELPPAYREPTRQHVHATTLGMARWQQHAPDVADEDELDDYMFEVAGRVGYLVTDLYAAYSPQVAERRDALMPLSRHCGLALQTVNVIRGMPEDYRRGWVFTPQTYYRRYGLTRDSLFDPRNIGPAMQVVNLMAAKADRHLEHGLAYITLFPRHLHAIRLSLMWPFLLAARTLAISRNNPQVLSGEAKVSRGEVRRIVGQTRVFGWSNHWLAHYYRRMSQPPETSAQSGAARGASPATAAP